MKLPITPLGARSIILKGVIIILAVNGIAYIKDVQVPNALDTFARSRVSNRQDLRAQFVNEVREEIEVPVLKESDVKGQINSAIKDSLTTPLPSAKR